VDAASAVDACRRFALALENDSTIPRKQGTPFRLPASELFNMRSVAFSLFVFMVSSVNASGTPVPSTPSPTFTTDVCLLFEGKLMHANCKNQFLAIGTWTTTVTTRARQSTTRLSLYCANATDATCDEYYLGMKCPNAITSGTITSYAARAKTRTVVFDTVIANAMTCRFDRGYMTCNGGAMTRPAYLAIKKQLVGGTSEMDRATQFRQGLCSVG